MAVVYQRGVHNVASWFYNYFAISVCPSVPSLWTPGSELIGWQLAGTSWHVLFDSSMRKQVNYAITINSRATTFLAKHHIAKEAQKNGNTMKKSLRNLRGLKISLLHLCRVSELHHPVDSQHQLECISSPVGSLTTCMVTTYMCM